MAKQAGQSQLHAQCRQRLNSLIKTKGLGAVPSLFNSCGKLENVSLCSFQGGGEKEIGRLYLKEK